MELSKKGIADRTAFEQKGYALPQFDREEMIVKTKKAPHWIHFGAGNIFRAFQSNVMQELLNKGIMDTGLLVTEGFDYEIIEKMNRPHDDLSILVTLKADGSIEKTVVGSIAESLILDSHRETELARLKEVFENPSLQMASFTITEKGYRLVNGKGELLPVVSADFVNGPSRCESYIGKVASLLYYRYLHDKLPIAMVSMDNCSHNGDQLYAAIHSFAEQWTKNNLVRDGFLRYIENPSLVSFPLTMIDKITPRPDPKVEQLLLKDEIDGLSPVITQKNTYVAPFVNAEECQYLIIEDLFPNGKLPLDEAGIIYTNRETVNKVEKMKVCTCLNPLHTALAIFGCLLGYTLISEEMKNPLLKKLIETIGWKEGMPVVINPGILRPEDFLTEVLTVRIPNPFMPDTPQRIATDTSQKLPIRFGETIKAYQASDTLNLADLKMIPLVFAGWLRYLMGIDDTGAAFERSSDPLLDDLTPYLTQFTLGVVPSTEDTDNILSPILHKKEIWGVDLYTCGLSNPVISDFREMLAGPGAVENALKHHV